MAFLDACVAKAREHRQSMLSIAPAALASQTVDQSEGNGTLWKELRQPYSGNITAPRAHSVAHHSKGIASSDRAWVTKMKVLSSTR